MKKIIKREIPIDPELLFKINVNETINNLIKLRDQHPNKDLIFEEIWYSYEDNYFALTCMEEETDEEYKERIEKENLKKQMEIEKLKHEINSSLTRNKTEVIHLNKLLKKTNKQ
jgi:hypothetical protein